MMNESEYKEVKKQELEHANKVVENIKADNRAVVKYKDIRPITDIKHMIYTSCELFGESPAFHQKFHKGDKYETISYNRCLEDVNGLGTKLMEMGLRGKRIAIIGENSYQWAISYLAVICGVGVVVPIDKELGTEGTAQIISDAEVSGVIYSDKYSKMIKDIKDDHDNILKCLINMNIDSSSEDEIALGELINEGKTLLKNGDKTFIHGQIISDEMAVLLFTSGTTGVSKGVMLSHRNLAADLMASPTVLKVNTWDIFFSVLPVHHTYECTCGFLMPLYKGASIAYCEGLKYITKNLAEVKPTMFLGVPAIFENLYKKIWQNIRKQGKEKLLKRVIKINKKTKKIGIDLGKIFFKDILAVFGGRMRMMICGGAAINPEVLDGIRDFGINAVQGYGLTECAPMGALNPDTAPVAASIGMAFPGIDVEIRDKNEEGIGEICIKGDNVMLGYYNMPEATAEALADGVFHTGDLGYIDEKGYIFLTGRKKNVIITKNGKNVYPEELEYLLNLEQVIAESMVFEGEAKSGEDTMIVASIVIDEEAIFEKYGNNIKDDEIEEIIESVVDSINKDLPFFKKIKHTIIRRKELKKNTAKKIIRYDEENKM
ncbi:MAG: AMP-binding protein [Anaerovoracaceae bacterium]